MSTPYPQLAERVGGGRASVLGGRVRERLLLGVGVLATLVLALAISIEMPHPSVANVALVVGVLAGAVAVVALMVSTRYAVTLTLLTLYLGLLDGPVKLESASKLASGVRDVLIIAIGLGMLMRLHLKRERVRMPPLSGWVLAFVAVVLVEALNPHTNGALKVIGGYRQALEFVPLFFFGYLIMRSKQRFRQLFLLLGVIALANGVVGAYQARLSPAQLASWGPGYGERVKGNGHGVTGRTYAVEGVAHPRPPALGSDSGFGGSVGTVALPGLLALLAVGWRKRRWLVLLCCMGAVLGIATSASRTSIIIAVVTLALFAALSVIAGLRIGRPLAVLVAILVLAGGVGVALVAAEGNSIFARQESVANIEPGSEKGGDAKEKRISEIPRDMLEAPLGLGLGVVGSASGFGGHEKVTIAEETVNGGSAYNLLVVELGAPGLLLWVALSLNVIVLGLRRLRRIADPELRLYLVAVLTTFIALAIQGFAGATLAVTPAGAYLWFVPGVIAYWFAGPSRVAMRSSRTSAVTAGGASPPVGAVGAVTV